MVKHGVRRSESHFRVAAGRRLFRRAWLSAEPERALVLVHGYAEHSGRYDALGAWFAERGAAVHAYDHQGHGRSEGARCHVDRFGDFLDDLSEFLDQVRHEHPGLPLTLVGHSMGGLITCALLCERQPPVAQAVTSGPALELGPGVSRGRILTARLLRKLRPRLVLGSGLDVDGLSRDPEVVRRYLEDPLIVRSMTASLAAELLDAIPRVASRADRVQVPMLMLHGADDPICPARGTQRFFAGLAGEGSRERVYPKLRHEIFNEPEREQVQQDIQDWLLELER